MTSSSSGSRSVKIELPSISDDHDNIFLVNKRAEVYLLCFNLSKCPRPAQLVLLSTGVFAFFLLYAYFQELMFRLPGFRPFGWYLTLIQFAFYVIFSRAEMKWQRLDVRRIPVVTYVQLAFYTCATMGLSNAAVGYLNFPTQVIFKCCKLIPVLIGGVLIQGKRFTIADFVAALLMSVGLILFTLADNHVSPNFDMRGYVMISFALVADAIVGNVQEKAMKAHHASNTEVVFYSYGIGLVYILIGIVISGEFFEAFAFCANNFIKTYGYASIFSVFGYFGINIVLTLVKTFGAFIAVTVTTCRKAVTIILSFLFFSKPFTSQYVWAGLIVLLGICLNDFGKHGLFELLRRAKSRTVGLVRFALAKSRLYAYKFEGLVEPRDALQHRTKEGSSAQMSYENSQQYSNKLRNFSDPTPARDSLFSFSSKGRGAAEMV